MRDAWRNKIGRKYLGLECGSNRFDGIFVAPCPRIDIEVHIWREKFHEFYQVICGFLLGQKQE